MPEINYFWDEIEDNVVREYDENNNTIVSYTTEPTLYGSVLSQDSSGNRRSYQFDGQGNTTELTDQGGNVTDSRRYTAFGETSQSSGLYEYAHQYRGAWGYRRDKDNERFGVRRRVLDGHQQRWLSIDPLLVERLVGAYTYCQNRPVDGHDPSGMLTTNLSKYTIGDCGKFNWANSWVLEGMEKRGKGFILQLVDVLFSVYACAPLVRFNPKEPLRMVNAAPDNHSGKDNCCCPQKFDAKPIQRRAYCYWEIFRYQEGRRIDDGSDHVTFPAKANRKCETCGGFRKRFYAVFVDSTRFASLNAACQGQFASGNVADAGTLLSRSCDKGFGERGNTGCERALRTLIRAGTFVYKDVEATWDCCPSMAKTVIVHITEPEVTTGEE